MLNTSLRKRFLQWIVATVVIILETQQGLTKELELGPSLSTLTSIYATGKANPKSLNEISRIPGVTVYLEDFPSYSVLVPLVNNKISSHAEGIFEERGVAGLKSFVLEAPKGYDGIIAVIQEIDLGSNEFRNNLYLSTQKTCANFIKFDDGENSRTPEICGKSSFLQPGNNPDGLIGPRSFISSTGRMIVSFKFGDIADFYRYYRYSYRQGNRQWPDLGPLYKLSLSFTAYKDCSDNATTNEDDMESLSYCTSNSKLNGTCINSDLFCDKIYNCGSDSDFGYDETNCPTPTTLPDLNDYLTDDSKTPSDHIKNELKHSNIIWKAPPDELGDHSLYPDIIDAKDKSSNYREGEISPASTILLIVFTVFAVMLLAAIIRFCCTKCAGTPLHDDLTSNRGLSNSTATILTMGSSPSIAFSDSNNMGISSLSGILINNQCSRVNYALDMPPSYEDLFPNSKGDSESINSIIVSVGSNAGSLPQSQNSAKVP